MTLAKIPSKDSYFVNEKGQFFNAKGNLLAGSLVNGTRILTFRDNNNRPNCKISFGQIVYQTFKNPNVWDGYGNFTIIKIKKNIEFEYAFSNLKKIPNKEMPGINNLIDFKSNLISGGKTFYADFNQIKLKNLIENLKLNQSNSKIAKYYNVSEASVIRAKKRLSLN